MEIRLNIIPEKRKKELDLAGRLRRILQWEFGFLMILTLFLMLLLSIYQLLQFNLIIQRGEIANGKGKNEFEKIAKFNDDFKAANKQISTDESVIKDQLYWSKLFVKLNGYVNPGISISKMATKNYSILLAGIAGSRDDLMQMKEALEKEECFTDVNLPLSSLAAKENINFQIGFNVKEECVKNK